MLSKQKAFILLGILFLTACAEKEDIVPGIRLDLRSAADVSVVENTNLSLPKAKVNKEWSHRNGSQSHFISHPSLSNEPVSIVERALLGLFSFNNKSSALEHMLMLAQHLNNKEPFSIQTTHVLLNRHL